MIMMMMTVLRGARTNSPVTLLIKIKIYIYNGNNVDDDDVDSNAGS